MFFRVLVRHDRRTGRMHPLVAVRVIEMPMRVHKMFNRVATDAIQRRGNFFARAQISRVDNEFSIGTRQDRNVATGTDERTHVSSKCLSRDLSRRATRACDSNKTLSGAEKALWHKADSGCRKTSRRNETSPRNAQRLPVHDYALINASKSALMTSACVVIMP